MNGSAYALGFASKDKCQTKRDGKEGVEGDQRYENLLRPLCLCDGLKILALDGVRIIGAIEWIGSFRLGELPEIGVGTDRVFPGFNQRRLGTDQTKEDALRLVGIDGILDPGAADLRDQRSGFAKHRVKLILDCMDLTANSHRCDGFGLHDWSPFACRSRVCDGGRASEKLA